MNISGRWTQLGGIGLILFVAVMLLYPESRAILNANDGALSGALSFLLVLLYFGQYRLQNRQISLENPPHIEIQRYEINSKEFELWLSNPGNGVATNLEIVTEINFQESKNIPPAVGSYRLRRLDEDGDRKRRVGNSLKAGEHNVRFIGEPHLALQNPEGDQGYDLLAGTGFLAQQDVEEIDIQFFIRGTDLLDNEYKESVFGESYTVELDIEGIDLDGIRNNRVGVV